MADGTGRVPRTLRALCAAFAIALALPGLARSATAATAQHAVAPASIQSTQPSHLTTANFWLSPSSVWEPPHSLAQAGDGVEAPDTPWEEVDLPHARARELASPLDAAARPPKVMWYRMQVPAKALAASPRGARLYIPRWQTIGTLAVYGNDRLLWQSRGSRVWNSFNRPVWIDLGGVVPDGTALVVYVRMASMQGAGGALSSMWVGQAETLVLSWRVRSLLQADGVAFSRGSYLVIGLFALVLWLVRRRRNESMYLLFFLLSVFHLLATLPYLMGNESVGIPDVWFAWITYVVGSLGSTVCGFYFLCAINHVRLRRLGRTMLLYAAVATLATVPAIGVGLESLLPVARLMLIPPGFTVIGVGVWTAWHRRTPTSILLALWLLLSVPVGFHDLGLQNYRGNIEGIYLTPYVYVGLFTMFLLIAFSRYLRALGFAEQAKANLKQRLDERERELDTSHQRLRLVEREQTLLMERQRLMREMHDGVGSSLMTALRVVEHGSAEKNNVAQMLKECIDDLKISIDSLEPADADLLALLARLRFRLGPRLEGAGLVLHWDVSDVSPLPWLDAMNALHILRTLQEVLTNIIKHSGARTITVSTSETPNGGAAGVQVKITDDGCAFSGVSASAGTLGARGLSNVRARVAALQGQCKWTAGANGGTQFALWLPLSRTH